MSKIEIPLQFMSAVGPNGSDLPKVREKCGGIMIALMPPEVAGGPLVAHVGPGTRQQVLGAEGELKRRLLEAEKGDKGDLGDAFNELMQDVQPHIEAKN